MDIIEQMDQADEESKEEGKEDTEVQTCRSTVAHSLQELDLEESNLVT